VTPAVSVADLYQSIDIESSLTCNEEFQDFKRAATQGNLVPVFERLFSDQLTPVVAYRCLVGEDDHELPSFLYESVVNGDQTVRSSVQGSMNCCLQAALMMLEDDHGPMPCFTVPVRVMALPDKCLLMQGRYSFVGAQPAMEIMAFGDSVTVLNHETQERGVSQEEDPLEMVVSISRKWKPVPTEGLPRVFTGGWSGYCGYDTVRYVYGGQTPPSADLGSVASPFQPRHDATIALFSDAESFQLVRVLVGVPSVAPESGLCFVQL
jgi:anthranilate synthase component 1